MHIDVLRYSDNGDSTLSLVMVDGKFHSYGLEDEHREIKVPGETCIPEGSYEMAFMEQLTPLTRRYRSKFEWFTWHLWVKDVPNFTGIYHHIGNKDEDTAGCLLVGNGVNNNLIRKAWLNESTRAYTRYYRLVSKALEKGEKVQVTYKKMRPLHGKSHLIN